MTINSLSGNFQQPFQEVSGKSLPDRTESTAPKLRVSAPASNLQISDNNAIETSQDSASEIAAKLNAKVENLETPKLERNTQSLHQNIQRSLRFQVDDATGGTVISVIDRQTDETIRQIPSEEMLALSRRLIEINEQIDTAKGVLFSSDA